MLVHTMEPPSAGRAATGAVSMGGSTGQGQVWWMLWAAVVTLLFGFVHAMPISQPQLHNLDLRMVEFSEQDEQGSGQWGLGDDLILEFKSQNLSGIVRLTRVDDAAVQPEDGHEESSRRHGKGNRQIPYDEKGAMYFAVSVVSMYGLSIGVLVAFSLRKDWDEDEVKNFQRSWVKIDHQMEKQEKQRAKKLMTRAIIAIHQPKRSGSVCATVTREAVYMALAPMALAAGGPSWGRSPTELCPTPTDRRPSRESIIWNNLPPPMVTIEENGRNPHSPRRSPSAGSGRSVVVSPGGTRSSSGTGDPLTAERAPYLEGNYGESDDEGEGEDSTGREEYPELVHSDAELQEGDEEEEEEEEDEEQLLEDQLLEGQLEEDMNVGGEVEEGGEEEPEPEPEQQQVGVMTNLGRVSETMVGHAMRGSRGHDSTPSLASPEADDDLDDDVFVASPSPCRTPADTGRVLQALGGWVHRDVQSPGLPYMDEDDPDAVPVWRHSNRH